MAKRTTLKSNRDTVLSAVTTGAFNLRTNEITTLKAIRDAGEADKTTRQAFILGHLASSIADASRKPMTEADAVAKAKEVLALKGATSTDPKRRTAAQDTMCAAARKAWSRIVAKAGAKATDTRGGSRKPQASKANEDKTVAPPPVVAKSTKVRTATEAASIFGDIAALVRSIRDGSAKALSATERDFAKTVITAYEAYAKAKAAEAEAEAAKEG